MANETSNQADVQQAVTAALEEQKKKKRKKKWIIIGIIAAVIVIISIAASSGGDSDTESPANAGQTTTAISANAPKAEKGKIGDYVCTIKSATVCEDYGNEKAVKIVYLFTNNSSDAKSFDIALDDNVYQDGIELKSTTLSIFKDGEDDDFGIDVDIKPGITKEVTKVYKLRNTTSKLEVEIGESFGFGDEKLTYSVNLG